MATQDDTLTIESIVSRMQEVLVWPVFESFKGRFDKAAGGYILRIYADMLQAVADRLRVLSQRSARHAVHQRPGSLHDRSVGAASGLCDAADEMDNKVVKLREASEELILEGMRRLSRGLPR